MSDKIGYIGYVIILLAFFALIGFLCWLFKNGWACLLIFFAPRLQWTNDKEDKDK